MGSNTQDIVLSAMMDMKAKGLDNVSAHEIYDEIRSHDFDIPIEALRNALYYMRKTEKILGDNNDPSRVPRKYHLK